MTLQEAVAELQQQIRCPHRQVRWAAEPLGAVCCLACGLIWKLPAKWSASKPASWADELCRKVARLAELAKENR